MEQVDQQAPVGRVGVQALPAGAARRFSVASVPRALFRYRVALAGTLAIALAISGELLQRKSSGMPTDGEWGTRLVQLALVLVGLVAWVNAPAPVWRLGRRKRVNTSGVSGAEPLPSRPIAARPARVTEYAAASVQPVGRVRAAWAAYVRAREGAGLPGTLIGLVVVGVLLAWGYYLLQKNFADPLAPWLWVAVLSIVLLTFAGVRTGRESDSLLPTDPAEPRTEPPLQLIELFLLGGIMAAAIFLRLWGLDHIPAGPYVDE